MLGAQCAPFGEQRDHRSGAKWARIGFQMRSEIASISRMNGQLRWCEAVRQAAVQAVGKVHVRIDNVGIPEVEQAPIVSSEVCAV